MAIGVGGAFALAVGLVLLMLALLRAVQVETAPHWTGHWSWLPYLVTLAVTGVLAGLVVRQIGAAKRKRSAR